MRLGPMLEATLIVRELDRSLPGYQALGWRVRARDALPQQRALDMGEASLAGAARIHLGLGDQPTQLTLIEAPHAEASAACARRGWIGLELQLDAGSVGVLDDFQAIGEPVVDDQGGRTRVLASANGELWTLRELRGDGALTPSLRAVQLACADRARTLGFYEGLGLCGRSRHDSASPPFYRRAELAQAQAYPRTVAELRGAQRIDILAWPDLPPADSQLRTGLRLLSFARSDAAGRRLQAADDPSARILAGSEGEGIELC